MPLDFLSVKKQIQKIAAQAPTDKKELEARRLQASELLAEYADKGDDLRTKVEEAAGLDNFLRSAKPTKEALNASFPTPPSQAVVTVIAADGSQINASPHEAINFHLINVGAIQLVPGTGIPPNEHTETEIHLNEYNNDGRINDDEVAQDRDTKERAFLAELVDKYPSRPLYTLTDGPLELWGNKSNSREGRSKFSSDLQRYLNALRSLHEKGVATAGYVDKPRADLVVRALEIAKTPRNQLADVRLSRLFLGVTDFDLFKALLPPGGRSALFELQSEFSSKYEGPLALHFFYLNVGTKKAPWLARVEVPSWVATEQAMLNGLHALLIEQSKIFGKLSYPYALHRAHEIAVVSKEDKETILRMLADELRKAGLNIGEESHKSQLKDLLRG